MPTIAHKETLETMIEHEIGVTPIVMVTQHGGLTLISIDELMIDEYTLNNGNVTLKREYYPPYHAARVVATTDELQAIADSYVKRGKRNAR